MKGNVFDPSFVYLTSINLIGILFIWNSIQKIMKLNGQNKIHLHFYYPIIAAKSINIVTR
jgi:hypothetical protein